MKLADLPDVAAGAMRSAIGEEVSEEERATIERARRPLVAVTLAARCVNKSSTSVCVLAYVPLQPGHGVARRPVRRESALWAAQSPAEGRPLPAEKSCFVAWNSAGAYA